MTTIGPGLLEGLVGCALDVQELYTLPEWVGPVETHQRFSFQFYDDGTLGQSACSFFGEAINLLIWDDDGDSRFRRWHRIIDVNGDQSANNEVTPLVYNDKGSGVVGANIHGNNNIFFARFGGSEERWMNNSGPTGPWAVPFGDPRDTLTANLPRHTQANSSSVFSIGGDAETYLFKWVGGNTPALNPSYIKLVTVPPTVNTYIAGITDMHVYVMRQGDIDENGANYELLKITIADLTLEDTFTSPKIIGTYSFLSSCVFCNRFWVLPEDLADVKVYDLKADLNELYSEDLGDFARCYPVSNTHIYQTDTEALWQFTR